MREVTFGEDHSTVRSGHAPQNLAARRNLVIGRCGLEAARQSKPGLQVILSSGYSLELFQQGVASGAGVRFLAKPYGWITAR